MPGVTFHVSVELDTSVLDGLIPTTKPTASSLVRKHAFQFEGFAKGYAPVDTGRLRNSIKAEMTGLLTAEVRDNTEYGVFQEFGVMHSYLIDSPVFIRRVGWRYIKEHPGFPPQPFFTPAAEQVGGQYFIDYFGLWLRGT